MNPVHLPIRHFRQHRDGECLAACAKMAMDYIGISVSYERLLKLLHIKPFGALFSMLRELEQLGVIVVYKQGTFDELYTHLTSNRPCIAIVQTGELPYWNTATDHAVVVVGLDEEAVYLNDPAFDNAPIQVSHGDFGLAWFERDEYYATLMRRS